MWKPAASLLCSALLAFSAVAQSSTSTTPANPDSGIVTTGTIAVDPVEESWQRLEKALNGTTRTDTRINALNALSLLGGAPRADKLVLAAIVDHDIDVRTAAIVAAGEMARSEGLLNPFQSELRQQLNGDDPRVVFTAASTLYKLDDPSGEDILEAVAEGERSADYTFWKSSRHNASRQLHSPAALAKIAAQQGLVVLVPPAGIGLGAYGYLRSNGGTSPQVTAITQLGRETSTHARDALIVATTTKDTGARIAAAEALSKFQGPEVKSALESMLTEGRENLRLTASAAYIRVVQGPHSPAVKTIVKTSRRPGAAKP